MWIDSSVIPNQISIQQQAVMQTGMKSGRSQQLKCATKSKEKKKKEKVLSVLFKTGVAFCEPHKMQFGQWQHSLVVNNTPPVLICNFQHTVYKKYITNQLTNYMKRSPSWEADRSSASRGIPRTLWNPKIHYRINNSPPHDPILSQINPVHDPSSHLLKMQFNIILPSTPGSSKWSPYLTSPHKNPYKKYIAVRNKEHIKI
jgi:hypothetical protein